MFCPLKLSYKMTFAVTVFLVSWLCFVLLSILVLEPFVITQVMIYLRYGYCSDGNNIYFYCKQWLTWDMKDIVVVMGVTYTILIAGVQWHWCIRGWEGFSLAFPTLCEGLLGASTGCKEFGAWTTSRKSTQLHQISTPKWKLGENYF